MQFGSKRGVTNLWYSWPTIIGLFVLCAILSFSVFERYQVEREMAARAAAATRELELMQERARELEARVEYLEGERGVEEEIRKNFDVAKAGEQVVILTGEAPAEPAASEPPKTTPKWYQFWR